MKADGCISRDRFFAGDAKLLSGNGRSSIQCGLCPEVAARYGLTRLTSVSILGGGADYIAGRKKDSPTIAISGVYDDSCKSGGMCGITPLPVAVAEKPRFVQCPSAEINRY